MARKRIVKRPSKTSEPTPSRKSGSRLRRRSEGGPKTDFLSCARTCALLLLVCGICGFLFYPDIISAMKKLRKADSQADDMSTPSPFSNRHERDADGDMTETVLSSDGDLMEDEFPDELFEDDEDDLEDTIGELQTEDKARREADDSRHLEDTASDSIEQKSADPSSNKELKHKSKKDAWDKKPKESLPDPKSKIPTGKSNTNGHDSVEGTFDQGPEQGTFDHGPEIEMRSRDGKRKPIILRPGSHDFTIDLSKSWDENVRVHEDKEARKTETTPKDKQSKPNRTVIKEKNGNNKPSAQNKQRVQKAEKQKSDVPRKQETQTHRADGKEKSRPTVPTQNNESRPKEKGTRSAESILVDEANVKRKRSSKDQNAKPNENKNKPDTHFGDTNRIHSRDGKRRPIILNGENNQITIEPSDLKNVDGEYHFDVKEKPKGTLKNSNGKQENVKTKDTSKTGSMNSQKAASTKKTNSETKTGKSHSTGTRQRKGSDSQSKEEQLPRKDVKNTNPSKVKNTKESKTPKSKTARSTTKAKKKDGNTKKTAKEKSFQEEVDSFESVYQKDFTPKKIFDGGRRIPPIQLLPQKKTNSSVRVYLFDDFLSATECDGLMKAHDKHVKAMSGPPLLCFDSVQTLRRHLKDVHRKVKVTPNVFTDGTTCLNASFSSEIQTLMKSNWSYSTAFYPGESPFSKAAADRIQRAMGLSPDNGGKFQITSYPAGKAYKTHTDCRLDSSDKRDRVVSVLMYLNTVEDGGETRFPDLGIWVKPRKGRAIVWNNMSPDGLCEPHSRHVATVVKTGSKYILIRWYYYKSFYSLGKRPPPPDLPPRDEKIPMVSCDEYNMGSCRWYDEWNYDIMLEYQRQLKGSPVV